MDTITYAMLIGTGFFFIFLLGNRERQKYRRYNHFLDMDVEVQLHEPSDRYDQMSRGNLMLHLHKCENNIKGIVVKELSFSNSAFYVPTLDKLYFKGKGKKSQLLSASFRIRRHSLLRLKGKQLHIHLSGWINDDEGNAQPFKASLPYTVQPAESNPAKVKMGA